MTAWRLALTPARVLLLGTVQGGNLAELRLGKLLQWPECVPEGKGTSPSSPSNWGHGEGAFCGRLGAKGSDWEVVGLFPLVSRAKGIETPARNICKAWGKLQMCPPSLVTDMMQRVHHSHRNCGASYPPSSYEREERSSHLSGTQCHVLGHCPLLASTVAAARAVNTSAATGLGVHLLV